MPLPTSIPETVGNVYERVVYTAQGVLTNLVNFRMLMDSGYPVVMDNMIGLYQALNAARDIGISIMGTDGLDEYAKATRKDENYDIKSEFAKAIGPCKAVTDHLLEIMPGDGKGGFLGWRLTDEGKIERVTIDVTSLAELRGLITVAAEAFDQA